MTKCKFISIEGTEGAGKSTAIAFVRQYLSKLNVDYLLTREPGGTLFAEQIRELVLKPFPEEKMDPQSELLLMFAGRVQHINHCIKPALHSGKWVISDRYIDSSYAYQGGGRNINQKLIQTLDQLFVGDMYPDLTLLLDVPAGIGYARAQRRETKRDRIEFENIDFFKRVRNVFLERAAQYPDRIKIINADENIQQVNDQIRSVLDHLMTEPVQ